MKFSLSPPSRFALLPWALFIFAVGLTRPVSAQVLRYTFDGAVSSVQVSAADDWSGVSAGEAVHLVIQIERDLPPTNLFVEQAEYLDVVSGFAVEIGSARSGSLDLGSVTVKNDDVFNSSCTDRLTWAVSGASSPGPSFRAVEISLSALEIVPNCPVLLSSLELPTALGSVPDPALNATNFTLFSDGFNVIIEGAVALTSIVEDFTSSCFGDGGVSSGCTSCPCGNDSPTGSSSGCSNSLGTSGRLAIRGLPSVTADSLRVEMTGGVRSSFAILSSGAALAPTNPSNPCFGSNSGIAPASLDGLRCVVMGVQRHGTRATDASGSVGPIAGGWGSPSGGGGGLIAQSGSSAGQTRYFQAVYREDPTAGCGTGQNTTQAVRVQVIP